MNEIKIKIQDKEFIIKQTFKGLRHFEELTGINSLAMTPAQNNLTNTMKMLYCILLAANKEFTYDYLDFEALLDENPNILEDFNTYIQNIGKDLPKSEKKTAKKNKVNP